MKILVVDDDELTLDLFEFKLRAEGYEIIRANNAYKALEFMNKGDFDIIITDIMMPDLSGLGLLSLLQNFYLNRKPVFLISSLSDKEVINSGLNLKATDFFIKPINFEKLIARIKAFEKVELKD